MIAGICAVLAASPLALALDNMRRLRTPAPADGVPAVSVLIPARNEAANIGAAVHAVLASRGVDLDLVVLDDGSTDDTADILAGIADPRLRVLLGGALPAGWSGKQHACARLADAARHDLMLFVDADVRLAPDAARRIAGFMQRNDVGLASGFPRQMTIGWAEILLLPLIHFLLLGYLPIARMQHNLSPGLGAGCGQLMMVRKDAYGRAGGHSAIRASLHDGIMLPRAFRRAGIMTGLFDATALASCRMYDSSAGVWEGLTKNATEGMAKPIALPIWTFLLAGGHVVPFFSAAGLACDNCLRVRLFASCLVGVAVWPIVAQRRIASGRRRGLADVAVGRVAAGGFRGEGDLAGPRLHGPGMIRAAPLALLLALPAHAASIVVTVGGIRNNHGHVRVAICPKAMFLRPQCPWFGIGPALPGDVRIVIQNVPPGTYAAEAFHDEDDNGKLERSFFGLPEEGMGFSNDAPMRFGPPAFGAASFDVGGMDGQIRFSMRYYDR